MASYDGFLLLLKAHGLPEPVREFKFHPDRKWRLDYFWPHHLVALEVEGGVWTGGRHTRGTGFKNDIEKYNSATILGIRLLRCTPQDIKSGAIIETLKEVLKWERY